MLVFVLVFFKLKVFYVDYGIYLFLLELKVNYFSIGFVFLYKIFDRINSLLKCYLIIISIIYLFFLGFYFSLLY